MAMPGTKGGFPILQKQKQDQHHQNDRITQGAHHTLNRLPLMNSVESKTCSIFDAHWQSFL